ELRVCLNEPGLTAHDIGTWLELIEVAGIAGFNEKDRLGFLIVSETGHRGRRTADNPADIVAPVKVAQLALVPALQWTAGETLLRQAGIGVFNRGITVKATDVVAPGQLRQKGGPARTGLFFGILFPENARLRRGILLDC